MSTYKAAQVMPSFSAMVDAGPGTGPAAVASPRSTLEVRPSFTTANMAQPGFPSAATDSDMIDDAGNTAAIAGPDTSSIIGG